MPAIHALFANRAKIQRVVTEIPQGVETVTESDDAEVAALIRTHVEAMHRRLLEGRPIHARDPLFAQIFRHRKAITMKLEPTSTGIKVIETSEDRYVVKLIRAHAAVVSRFLSEGRREMMRDHAPPARD